MSFFQIWSCYAKSYPNANSLGLPAITTEQISIDDLKKSHSEFRNFIHPYFWQPRPDMPDKLAGECLKKLTPQAFLETFSWPGVEQKLYADMFTEQLNIFDLAKQYTRRDLWIQGLKTNPLHNSSTNTKIFEEHKKTLIEFYKALDKMLLPEQQNSLKGLSSLYRSVSSCRKIATQLVDDLIDHTKAPAAFASDPDRKRRLTDRLAQSLWQEISR